MNLLHVVCRWDDMTVLGTKHEIDKSVRMVKDVGWDSMREREDARNKIERAGML